MGLQPLKKRHWWRMSEPNVCTPIEGFNAKSKPPRVDVFIGRVAVDVDVDIEVGQTCLLSEREGFPY